MHPLRPLPTLALLLAAVCALSGCGPRESTGHWTGSGGTHPSMGGGGSGSGGAETGTGTVTLRWTFTGLPCASEPFVSTMTVSFYNTTSHQLTTRTVPCTNNGVDGMVLEDFPNGHYEHQIIAQDASGTPLFASTADGDHFDGAKATSLTVDLQSYEYPPDDGSVDDSWPWPYDDGSTYDDGSSTYDDGSSPPYDEGSTSDDDGSTYDGGPPDDEGSPRDGGPTYDDGPPDDDGGGPYDDGSYDGDLSHRAPRSRQAARHPGVHARASR